MTEAEAVMSSSDPPEQDPGPPIEQSVVKNVSRDLIKQVYRQPLLAGIAPFENDQVYDYVSIRINNALRIQG